jgi:hypothetical protein
VMFKFNTLREISRKINLQNIKIKQNLQDVQRFQLDMSLGENAKGWGKSLWQWG